MLRASVSQSRYSAACKTSLSDAVCQPKTSASLRSVQSALVVIKCEPKLYAANWQLFHLQTINRGCANCEPCNSGFLKSLTTTTKKNPCSKNNTTCKAADRNKDSENRKSGFWECQGSFPISSASVYFTVLKFTVNSWISRFSFMIYF